MSFEVWQSLTLGLCFAVIGSFAWLIKHYGGVLMGFTIMAGLQIFLGNLSAFFLSKVFVLPIEFVTSAHLAVWTYSACGLFVYALGAWWAWRPLRNGMATLNPFLSEPRLVGAFAVFGSAITLFARLLPAVPTISPILYKLAVLIQLALLGAICRALDRNALQQLVWVGVVFVPVGLVTVVMTGFAGMMGSFLLQPLLLILLYRHPALWKFGVYAIGLYAFFVLAGIWFSTRDIIRGGSLEGMDPIGRTTVFYNQFGRAASDSMFEPLAVRDAAARRVDLSIYNAAQVDWMPHGEPYSMGRSLFIDPLLSLVPRLVWKAKPITLGDSEFINRYTGLTLSNERISVDTNITFELYANFGWPGVVCGLFAFGYGMARLELRLFRPGQSLTSVVVLSVLLFGLSSGGRRAAAMVLELGPSVAGAYLLAKVMRYTSVLRL